MRLSNNEVTVDLDKNSSDGLVGVSTQQSGFNIEEKEKVDHLSFSAKQIKEMG